MGNTVDMIKSMIIRLEMNNCGRKNITPLDPISESEIV